MYIDLPTTIKKIKTYKQTNIHYFHSDSVACIRSVYDSYLKDKLCL